MLRVQAEGEHKENVPQPLQPETQEEPNMQQEKLNNELSGEEKEKPEEIEKRVEKENGESVEARMSTSTEISDMKQENTSLCDDNTQNRDS
ncbi:Hypothetical predicted protein [Octopus vulgaris]|uniref:Uncharacterized protein n=1 Tax=Octopus vulgaris TaxID=6645 RepID=A0AA36BAX9_OCTVU|nr:Hypothetical predicted protein [Octopus vulgaris]